MIEADRRDRRHFRLHHVGGIQPPPHPDLDHRRITSLPRELQEGHRRHELKERGVQVHAAPPLNLRQGIYAPRRVSVFRTANWLGLARMSAIAALLGLLLMLVWRAGVRRYSAMGA